MTAAELNALVEPLWKVWPECRPVSEPGDFTAGRSLLRVSPGGAFWEGDGVFMTVPVPIRYATALIRVAIEDALFADAWYFQIIRTIGGPPAAVMVIRDLGKRTSEHVGRGETILHALVAAALAVAESRKETPCRP